MSTGLIIAIAAAFIVVLGVLVVIVTARKQDTRRGEGALSRETLQRDRSTTMSSGDLS